MMNLLMFLTIVNPFMSDGCTGFPEGTLKAPKLWGECCFEHDLHYWSGGTETARDKADLFLRDCVKEKGHPMIAELMYFGVRFGKNSTRKIKGKEWGNAWEMPGYSKLTSAQILEIKGELPKIDIPRDMELRFLENLEADSK